MNLTQRILRKSDDAISYRAFSLPGSPFHLFHPAPIEIRGKKFNSAGSYIVYSLASKCHSVYRTC